MEKTPLKVGDVVQLNPSHKFSGMILVVTEPKDFGAQGYLMSQFNFEAVRFNNVAYLRVKFEDIEYVGKIAWMYDPEEVEHVSATNETSETPQ